MATTSDNIVTAHDSKGNVVTSAAALKMLMDNEPDSVTFIDTNGKGEFTGDKLPSTGTLSVQTKGGGSVAKVTKSGRSAKVS